MQALGEATPAEVAEAGVLVSSARDAEDALVHAEAILAERLSRAEADERAAARAALDARGAELAKRRGTAVKSLGKALEAVRSALAESAGADADAADLRAELAQVLDVDGQEQRIRARFQAEWDEARQAGRPLNAGVIQDEQDAALDVLRAEVASEAQRLAPEADPDALSALVDEYDDVLPSLVDSATRRVLREGREFVQAPRQAGPVNRGTGRFFAPSEMSDAIERHDSLLALIDRLAGPAGADPASGGRRVLAGVA